MTIEQLEQHRSGLDGGDLSTLPARVTENARVIEAGEALERHDLSRFGRLMADVARELA